MVRALMRPICGFLELDLFIGQEKKKSKKGTKKGKGEKHIEKVENKSRSRPEYKCIRIEQKWPTMMSFP